LCIYVFMNSHRQPRLAIAGKLLCALPPAYAGIPELAGFIGYGCDEEAGGFYENSDRT